MKAGVLTVSDRVYQKERKDLSGPIIKNWLSQFLKAEVNYRIVPDELALIKEVLQDFIYANCRVILTTGGTGFGARDRTPEATRAVLEKEAPGIGEYLRRVGERSTPLAVLSRGIAGIAGGCLIINLPGSPKAVRESLEALEKILPHAIEVLEKGSADCGALPR